MLKYACEGSTLVINCPWDPAQRLDDELAAKMHREIAQQGLDLYTVDAHVVAVFAGLPAKRVKQLMQGTPFHLTGALPPDVAKGILEHAVDGLYGRKSPHSVRSNKAEFAAAVGNLKKIDYPRSWAVVEDSAISMKRQARHRAEHSAPRDQFSSTPRKATTCRKGGAVPTSAFLAGDEYDVEGRINGAGGAPLPAPASVAPTGGRGRVPAEKLGPSGEAGER